MKPGVYLGVGAFVILFFLFFPSRSQATTDFSVMFSEVSLAGDSANDEFIELYNPSDIPLSIAGWQLRRRTESGTESSIKVFGKDALIPAHGYYLWANSHGVFASPLADTETTSPLSDNNSLALYTSSGTDGLLIESISWGSGTPFSPNAPRFSNLPKKSSFTKDITTLLWSMTEFLTPTNSRHETVTPPSPDPLSPETAVAPAIRLNEIYANPTGEESTEEFIELYNPSSLPTDLSGYRIHDASKSGEYTFPAATRVEGNSYFVLKRSISKISLNNSSETLSLFKTDGILIETVSYNKTREGVSYNFTPHGWRGGTPTPGTENIINTLPETKEKVPEKGYRGFSINFDARGSDEDHDTLKYVWDFGDGHKSYKKATHHTYLENGLYTITLITSDGQDDVTEVFPLEIISFPKPDIRIVKLIPNPTGSDTNHEFLLIENRGKKTIDLKGFSIATGWKKLVNHPIREKFIIPAGSTKKLTHDISLFTLPNQKGKIELRAPDDSVLQAIKYKLPKTAAEDASYQKEKGGRWQWHNEVSEKLTIQVTAEKPREEQSQTELPKTVTPQSEAIPPSASPEDIEEKQVLGAETMLEETVSGSISPEPITEPTSLSPWKRFLQKMNELLNHWQNHSSI